MLPGGVRCLPASRAVLVCVGVSPRRAARHPLCLPTGLPANRCAVQLGSGSFKGTRFKTKADRMQYLELKLSPDKIAKYAGSKERLQLALMIPALNKDRIDGLRFRAGDSGSPPFLVLKASCKA